MSTSAWSIPVNGKAIDVKVGTSFLDFLAAIGANDERTRQCYAKYFVTK